MSIAVLYRWRITSGREEAFCLAWEETTRVIHERCGSHGARLHRAANGDYWSYALWPSESARQACRASTWLADLACVATMRECVAERFEEVCLEIASDWLFEKQRRHPVPLLTTERLLLRPLALSDATRLAPALCDDDNMRYWSRGPLADEAQVREYMRWNVDGAGVQCFAVCHADRPQDAQGWIVLIDRRPAEAEVGFIMRPDAQRQGLAREAGSCVLTHAFSTRGLRRVFGDVDPDNRASMRLLEALGMRREGHLRGTWVTHLGLRDSYIYARLSTDS